METASGKEKKEAHIRGVKVTAFSSIAGILAGIISWYLTSSMGYPQKYGIIVLAVLVAVQKPFLPYLGKEEMGAKDWLYVAFMTFDLWFVSWTVLLTG
ncbi:MAG: hypothetical protein ABEK59_01875 [Halobacteria archaeon]